MSGSPSEVLEYFKGVPGVSKAYVAERLLAVVSALAWLVVFVLLAIDEVLSLVWLGSGAVPGDSGLAVFSVVTIALALAALIMAPALYLFIPVLLPLDLIPHGLKKEVGPGVATADGCGFVKLVLRELESAVERAAEKVEGSRGLPRGRSPRKAPRKARPSLA